MAEITVKIDSKMLAKKLNSMYDYVFTLELNSRDNYLIIADRHSLERMPVKKIKQSPDAVIRHTIDRRELSKKLKAISSWDCYMTFDTETHLIILESMDKQELSSYCCLNEPSRNKEEADGMVKWGIDVFKAILGIT